MLDTTCDNRLPDTVGVGYKPQHYRDVIQGAGPLGWSVLATGNALVFHSIDLYCSLMIHAAPLLSSWTLRWHAERFYAAFPGLAGTRAVLDDATAATNAAGARGALAMMAPAAAVCVMIVSSVARARARRCPVRPRARSPLPCARSPLPARDDDRNVRGGAFPRAHE